MTRFLHENIEKIEVALLLSIILITFIFYVNTLWKGNGLIIGIDAPYYMIQVRNILSNGSMKYPDPPLVFMILSLMTLLIGNLEWGFVIGVSLLALSAAIPFYIFIRKVTNSFVLGMIGVLLIYYSPDYLRMLGDFVKNQFGIIFIGISLLLIYDVYNLKHKVLLLTIIILLASLTHVLDLAIILLIILSLLIYRYITSRQVDRDLLIVLLIVGALNILGFFLLSFYFGDIQRGVGFIRDLLSGTEAPSIHVIRRAIDMWIILVAFSIYLTVKIYRKEYREGELLFPFLVLLLFLIFPWPSNWSFRFMLMTYIPFSIMICYILSKVEHKLLVVTLGLIILSTPIMNSITLAGRLRPTINQSEYNDLVAMKNYVSDDNVYLLFKGGPKRYWAEYIIDPDYMAGKKTKIPKEGDVYLILPRDAPPPPLAKLLYNGKSLDLYKLPPKP